MEHLLSIQDLSLERIESILKLSQQFFEKNLNEPLTLLKHRSVALLFFENSTRTKLSFEQAVRRLGGQVIHLAVAQSSMQKGETLLDTAKNIQAMNPHGIVVRHSSAGGALTLAQNLKLPVINAGDGFHEHPTQALLDVFTIQQKLGSIRGKHIVIIGDIAHSRVARSNIGLMLKMGAKVSVCGPPTLLPPFPEKLGVHFALRPETLLPSADVVMALRIQLERQNNMQVPSIHEYTEFWGLNQQRARLLKKDALILHPGPLNRGIEIDPEVADGPHSVILSQVSNGILVRMSVLAHALRGVAALKAEGFL
jgi:aspartate carbamoyltransferase catalytic subunit